MSARNSPGTAKNTATSLRPNGVTHIVAEETVSRDESVQSSAECCNLLLDLSGDKQAAIEWANNHLPAGSWQLLNKAEFKWESKRAALSRIRELKPQTFALFTADLQVQSARSSMMLFAALCGAQQISFADTNDRQITRTRIGTFIIEGTRLILEFLIGYAIIVPLSWVLTWLLNVILGFRSVKPVSRPSSKRAVPPGDPPAGGSASKPNERRDSQSDDGGEFSQIPPKGGTPCTALYIRATLVPVVRGVAAGGGMNSHITGFANGAWALGHQLKFISSGGMAFKHAAEVDVIKPSAAIGATRALFEIWNNLVFTVSILRQVRRAKDKPDFIYQRYSRFNWTGVALSIVTGLPLALEFNGSEVWIARHWDPVGFIGLLQRYERLNLRAASAIFVVSDVQKRLLMDDGVEAARICVNPNGVDVEEFHPACGGQEVRRELGLENKIVIGFTGTFGPWHGAPVLGEAATRVQDSRCHFLFVGDGDERAATEHIIEAAGKKACATFTGRIPHHRVAAYLDACDILVAPHAPSADGSEFFGSPTKLFEYMAMARPIVASRLGQIASVIVDGENGLLVAPKDAAALAQAIERLANDEALRQRLGAAAQQTVIEQYTWQHNAARVFKEVFSFRFSVS